MNQKTVDYVHQHADADVRQLALQGCSNPEVDMAFALDQIAGRQKAKAKLPSWAANEGIVYPPHLSMEQCSSERTAQYKAVLGERCLKSGWDESRFVDLTGGFGVDFSFIARRFSKAVYVERQANLCAIASDNFKTLGLNAEVVCADGIDFLHTIDHVNLIFLDPARRDQHGARTYGIADCTPNVFDVKEELLAKADFILLKLSPMLDWRKAVADLGCVTEVHIVSVDNECKELLLMMSSDRQVTDDKVASLPVVCANLLADGNVERFEFDALAASAPSLSSLLPSRLFLFEPNASVMKAGCFQWLSYTFAICQVDKNSHLFVSDKDVGDFPGRRFVIEKVTSMNKRELKDALRGIEQANIAVRNFPLPVAELRKRLKLKDGGDIFIFATTIADEGHRLLICRKIG